MHDVRAFDQDISKVHGLLCASLSILCEEHLSFRLVPVWLLSALEEIRAVCEHAKISAGLCWRHKPDVTLTHRCFPSEPANRITGSTPSTVLSDIQSLRTV